MSKLSTEKAEAFHTAVAKCLWISERGGSDVQTLVSFLTTRVREPDVCDWKNQQES